MSWRTYALIFVAGLVSAVTTGVGTVPFFWVDDVADRLDVGLWGLAGGLMASASIFGLGYEMYSHPGGLWIGLAGVVGGALLVVTTHGVLDRLELNPDATDIAAGDFYTIASVLFVLLIHSFPEGVAVGVSFAHLESSRTVALLGVSVPVLAIVMTITIGIHNIPEGVAIGVPLSSEEEVGNGRMFWAAALSSLPQPLGAVVAYAFLQLAQQFLEFGYGFAAGAMLYLVARDIVPEGLEAGSDVAHEKRYLAAGGLLGFVCFLPLVFLL